jgi:hypothetical protein
LNSLVTPNRHRTKVDKDFDKEIEPCKEVNETEWDGYDLYSTRGASYVDKSFRVKHLLNITLDNAQK